MIQDRKSRLDFKLIDNQLNKLPTDGGSENIRII